MSKKSRDKGKRGEREVCELLRQVPGWEPKRSTQAADGGDYSDVEGTPYWIEAKLSGKPNPGAALKQALEATDGRPAVAFTRQCSRSKSGEWLVTMRADDFVALQIAVHSLRRMVAG